MKNDKTRISAGLKKSNIGGSVEREMWGGLSRALFRWCSIIGRQRARYELSERPRSGQHQHRKTVYLCEIRRELTSNETTRQLNVGRGAGGREEGGAGESPT